MISNYMIITALATTALAKESIECNFSKPTGARQCFGAVGQQLIFHLPNTANTEIWLQKDNTYMILKIVKNLIVTLHEEYVNQPELFTNGTVKLGNAMKRHSGDYLMEEFGSNGALLKDVIVRLEIKEPVSKPAVSQMCVSPEEMEVSCSSKGDEVEFNLTLDGLLLVPTRGLSQGTSNWTANTQSLAGNEADQDKANVSSVTISLHGQLTGKLTCSVQNKVSREETVIQLKRCQDPVLKPDVSEMCLSPEEMHIGCSSEGDELEFILTLDGLFMVQTRVHIQVTSSWKAGKNTDQDKPSVSSVTFSLYDELTGNLTCHAGNNVSRDETLIHLTNCKETNLNVLATYQSQSCSSTEAPKRSLQASSTSGRRSLMCFISHVLVEVVRTGVVILLVSALCLGVYHVYQRTRPTTVNEGISEGSILYSAAIYKM